MKPSAPDVLNLSELPVEFGRYTLLNVLGQGGMARVYRAEVAHLAGDATAARNALAEAKQIAATGKSRVPSELPRLITRMEQALEEDMSGTGDISAIGEPG